MAGHAASDGADAGGDVLAATTADLMADHAAEHRTGNGAEAGAFTAGADFVDRRNRAAVVANLTRRRRGFAHLFGTLLARGALGLAGASLRGIEFGLLLGRFFLGGGQIGLALANSLACSSAAAAASCAAWSAGGAQAETSRVNAVIAAHSVNLFMTISIGTAIWEGGLWSMTASPQKRRYLYRAG